MLAKLPVPPVEPKASLPRHGGRDEVKKSTAKAADDEGGSRKGIKDQDNMLIQLLKEQWEQYDRECFRRITSGDVQNLKVSRTRTLPRGPIPGLV
jgi:hypothetical protein